MKTSLYRMYDTDNNLLYVGVSSNPVVRMGQHGAEKDWYQNIRYIEIEWFEGRDTAINAERYAILRERPAYNIKKPPQRKPKTTPKKAHKSPPVKKIDPKIKVWAERVCREADRKRQDIPPYNNTIEMVGPPNPYRKIAITPKGITIPEIPIGHQIIYEEGMDTDILKFSRFVIHTGDLIYVHDKSLLVREIVGTIKERRAYILKPQKIIDSNNPEDIYEKPKEGTRKQQRNAGRPMKYKQPDDEVKAEICELWNNPRSKENPDGYSRKQVIEQAVARCGDWVKEHHIKHWCGPKRGE